MFLTGIEKNGFDKGEVIGIEKGIAKDRKEMFDNAVQSFMEKGLTKGQAVKEALEILRLNKIPE